jgi:spore coat polysaccharide biosynthesis protein SpsF
MNMTKDALYLFLNFKQLFLKDKNKILLIIQARRGSTRLRDKILLHLYGKELLVRMVERVKASRYGKNVLVATTNNKDDDVIVDICKRKKILFFRGTEFDLLDRHYRASLYFNADVVAKIPSDCPLIDPVIIDKVFDYFFSSEQNFDYVSNLHPATYPDGNDVEVMKFGALESAWENAKEFYQREHTTPYIWDNPDLFKIGNVKWESGLDYSMSHRFTIDYNEDYEFIKKVFEELYPSNPLFGLDDILNLIENQKPELKKINKKYLGVNWYRNHLEILKTISPEQTRII